MKSPHLTEPELRQCISINLLKLRKKHRYSQQNVAWALHITQSYYHQLETGKSPTSIYHLHLLALFYETKVEQFLRKDCTHEEDYMYCPYLNKFRQNELEKD